MANVLEKIVIDKRVVIEEMKKSFPLESFIHNLTPTTKSMYETLSKPEAGFILECKKASPSKGLIRPDFDVKAICQIYDKYAAAISVLTDEKYFQGKYEYLKTVTETVSCPVLNKDFFFDTYQVHLARYYGADAILLMLSVLNDKQYLELAEVAEHYNMSILTEISNEEEMHRAINLNAKLIGINNRNLRDLSTDIARTFDFAPHIPDDRLVISESGIYNHAQVRELAPAVDGFLVGSSIMAQDDIDLACRQLIFGNNKVCGLTKTEYAQAAKSAGAVYGGLIFAEKSPRYVTKAQATEIVQQVTGLNYVGVFVNHDIKEVIDLAASLNLAAVQLHGGESQAYIDELKVKFTEENLNCEIWQALKVNDAIATFAKGVDHIILDGQQPGSGQAFNWQLLDNSEQDLSVCFLAGGLGEANINDALAQLSAQELFGLDLNSGVESSPGNKCSDKLNSVFAAIRNY